MPRLKFIPDDSGRGKYGPPKYDITNRSYVRNELRAQADLMNLGRRDRKGDVRAHRPRYFSYWHETNRWLNNSRPYKSDLKRAALQIKRELRAAIPEGDPRNGHVRDDIFIAATPRGNRSSNRMAYQVFFRDERSMYANFKSGRRPEYDKRTGRSVGGTRWSDQALANASRKRIG